MKIHAEIKGSKELSKQLENLPELARASFAQALEESAILLHEECVKSMRKVSRGRVYRRGNVTHIASKPGDPPNVDTGQLISSIKWEIDEKNLEARVGTNVDYGVGLEFGTATTAPRPWLMPAMQKVRSRIVKLFKLKKVK